MLHSFSKEFFAEVLENIRCEKITKSYVAGVFQSFAVNKFTDLSKDSITLKYIEASSLNKFNCYQELADWILFTSTMFPGKDDSYPELIAKISYDRCWKLINKKWVCFEELSDNFELIVRDSKKAISSLR